MPTNTKESGFESLIVDWLVTQNGYDEGTSDGYNREYAIDEPRLFGFLEETQPERTERLGIRSDGPERTKFLNRLCAEVAERGAGNPPNPSGIMTDYLWKDIWTRDELAGIIENYAHVVKEKDPITKKITEKQVFPRYHQLSVVKALLADVQERGVGRRYLIQHSAGSGKSNSIGLAIRLPYPIGCICVDGECWQ